MKNPQWSPRRFLFRGVLTLVLGLGGFAVWSVLAQVNGAVVASGQVSIEARQQAIQHPDGGLVVMLHVRDGSRVAAGDPILTLDGTDLIAQRAVLQRQLIEILARLDRLAAELRQQDAVSYRQELLDMESVLPDLASVLQAESLLFAARRATLDQTDAQLAERQVQSQAIVAGRLGQLDASQRQLAQIQDDLAAQETLLERGVISNARVSELRREAARLDGSIGELIAGIAEARSGIAGFELEKLRQRALFQEAAQGELRELQPREAEIRERLRIVDARIGRLVLRAPMSGSVLGLRVHTVGGVVPAGAEIASIVPTDVPLVLSVEIDPGQIDRVSVGQEASIRFPNFNASTTPEVFGQVTTVSADAFSDQSTGRRFFVAELSLNEGAADLLGDVVLHPGMPVDAFIQTDVRTPASFLLKPVADYWAYAMREE